MWRQRRLLAIIICNLIAIETIKKGEADNGELHIRATDGTSSPHMLCATGTYNCFRDTFLEKVLIPRVPGSVGHTKVKEFIVGILKHYGWHVHLDEFYSTTPKGLVHFTNIVAILEPSAQQKRVFAAHYDSKDIPPVNGKPFMAATDSAVPVALLLDIAMKLGTSRGCSERKMFTTPMLIFFDGEEAFNAWSLTDSLYGSRHLALRLASPNKIANLSDIDSLILLDLVGGPSMRFRNYNQFNARFYGYRIARPYAADTVYDQLRLTELALTGINRYFAPGHARFESGDDDHAPFARRGVACVHLIAMPYPAVWHTIDDDEQHLDKQAIETLIRVFRAYTMTLLW